MSAWRKYMKPIAIGGGAVALAATLVLSVTAGGCQAHIFSKGGVRQTDASTAVPCNADDGADVHRRELDELLSIE